jgi:hypothetical protein
MDHRDAAEDHCAVSAWIEKEYGIVYESRSGLVTLLHRLGMEHRKPKAVSSKLDPDKQAAFIQQYETLLNSIGDDEATRRDRSRDRQDPHDRGGHGERDQHDPVAEGDRGDVSGQAADHLFVDNARYHHTKLVQAWLTRPECRVELHSSPPTARTWIQSSGSGA